MLDVLADRTYRHLFASQIIALLGTGLATVALGLLAFSLAGADAGTVLGIALGIKMIAYVGIAPIASAITERLPRRATLITLDLFRAGVAVLLPFVTEIWQIYVLIFLLQSASACYTPAFQATIPDVLPEEKRYTRALSLSRLAYDLESAASPLIAAALLAVVSFNSLFIGTVLGFIGAALLVFSVALPYPQNPAPGNFYDRMTKGVRIYLKTPRLRGMLALGLAPAAAGSMVLVNTVVLVQSSFGLGQKETALALAAYGGGSMIAALTLPRLLDRLPDRTVMIAGTAILTIACGLGSLLSTYQALLALWLLIGIGFAMTITPAGRLIRRSSNAGDRTALFAAQFALSHATWLICYPLAGWLGAGLGISTTFLIVGLIAGFGLVLGSRLWRTPDTDAVEHTHADLPRDHPHLANATPAAGGYRHKHTFVIDADHLSWPTR
ncbi:MFS transporter [Pelagibacterium flavum]|uniref:MFS transporter n=1 Tax=Pelagibacterium flavum TaxID=2984530 RepID=A0ABY6IS45_9HYPH|nr:MFS transporter [Pelagibacterium sp. YIM 151497]UYQ72264.1 MFS transporter [Pelagibacterium sp. YIM 151497]